MYAHWLEDREQKKVELEYLSSLINPEIVRWLNKEKNKEVIEAGEEYPEDEFEDEDIDENNSED